MTTHSMITYVQLKDAWLNSTMRVLDGKKEFLEQDEWISEEEFNRLHPYPEYKRYNEKGDTIGNLLN